MYRLAHGLYGVLGHSVPRFVPRSRLASRAPELICFSGALNCTEPAVSNLLGLGITSTPTSFERPLLMEATTKSVAAILPRSEIPCES